VLRAGVRKDQASKPLIGFGDPIFDPNEPPAAAGQRTARRGVNTRAFNDFWHGVDADRSKLSSLPRLADTADELSAIAHSLGAPTSDVHLRADASETTVKRATLAEYRVVYYARDVLPASTAPGARASDCRPVPISTRSRGSDLPRSERRVGPAPASKAPG
jgi:hypothetical protein